MSSTLNAKNLTTQAQALGRMLTKEEADQLVCYLSLLVKWNQRMNLVGPSSWEHILEALIQDSWHLADLFFQQNICPKQTLDLGAGAGLPGIPLRIFWQRGEYFLVEPRQKRALFMQQAIIHLALPQTMVIQGRMEDLSPKNRQADLLVSRAFRPWRELLQDVQNYLAPQGQVVIMSNDPKPQDKVQDYTLELVWEYTIMQKKRYFWLFTFRREGFSQIGHE